MRYSELDKNEIECEGFIWGQPIFAVRMKNKQIYLFKTGEKNDQYF